MDKPIPKPAQPVEPAPLLAGGVDHETHVAIVDSIRAAGAIDLVHKPTGRVMRVHRVEDSGVVHLLTGLRRGQVVLSCEHADHPGTRSPAGALHKPVRNCTIPSHVEEHYRGADVDDAEVCIEVHFMHLEHVTPLDRVTP